MREIVFMLGRWFPKTIGTIFVALGLWLVYSSADLGAEYAQFEGGARVDGRVETVSLQPRSKYRYDVEVSWTSDAARQRAVIQVDKAELHERRGGGYWDIPLVVSKTAADHAKSVREFHNTPVVEIAGRPFALWGVVMGVMFCLALNPWVFAQLDDDD